MQNKDGQQQGRLSLNGFQDTNHNKSHQEESQPVHMSAGEIDLEEGEIDEDDETDDNHQVDGQNRYQSLNSDSNSNSMLPTDPSLIDATKLRNMKRNKRNKRDKKRKKQQQERLQSLADGDEAVKNGENEDHKISMHNESPWTFTNPIIQPPSLLTSTFMPMIPTLMPTQQVQLHQMHQQPLPILQQAQQQAKTLFDLFPLASTSAFIDPTITEKENNKPQFETQQQQQRIKQQAQRQQQKEAKKRKANNNRNQPDKPDSKKMEKKRRFLEQMRNKEKEKQKREIEWKEKCNETVCKFFLEDRCTKGNDCPFSHDFGHISKNSEVCKYYLTGYCGKNDKCTFMHAEFPCKFYHTGRGECTNLDKCRFSHEPLNDVRRCALEKYLKEMNDNSVIILPPTGSTSPKHASILGSPPRFAMSHDPTKTNHQHNTPLSLMGHDVGGQTSAQALLIPSLMNLNIPSGLQQTTQNTPHIAPQVIPQVQNAPNKSPTFDSLFCQDIDERYIPPQPMQLQAPLHVEQVQQTADIDERALHLKLHQQSTLQANTALLNNLLETTNMEPSSLLAKLLNTKDQTDVVLQLINTLTATIPPPSIVTKPVQLAPPPPLLPQSQSTASGELALNSLLQQLICSQQDVKAPAVAEEVLEIDGRVNYQLPYILRPIDVEPSSLWSTKPLVNTSLSMEDQEFDPRIGFYSNIANYKPPNSVQQSEKQSPTTASGVGLLRSSGINDPRLASKQQSSDPDQQQQSLQQFINTAYQNNDLLHMHNRSNTSSLLSSLPDLKLPNKSQQQTPASTSTLPSMSSSSSSSQPNDYSSVIKLSIDDYKRKLQKPHATTVKQNGHSNRPSATSAASPPHAQDTKQAQQQQLPKIPSYSIGLDLADGLGGIKTPQSLHELLKNFPT